MGEESQGDKREEKTSKRALERRRGGEARMGEETDHFLQRGTVVLSGTGMKLN